MFERFTGRARQVVVLAQDEARQLGHNYIGTEHILLGLLREEEGIAARVLEQRNIDVEAVRARVAEVIGRGDEVASGQIPFTPKAKRALESAVEEASALGHHYIGTEHVLLGIAREPDAVAVTVLSGLGVRGDEIRADVLDLLGGGSPRETRRRAALVTARPPFVRLILPLLVAAAGFPLGLLVGWLIWG